MEVKPVMRNINIPFIDAPWGTLQLPIPMTKENWEQMENVLKVVKTALMASTDDNPIPEAEGYSEPYTEGADDGRKRYLRDASGYKSRYGYIAIQLSPDIKCERCGKPACSTYGKHEDRFTCLQCRDDWGEFFQGRSGNLKNWDVLFKEFCKKEA